MYYADKVKRDAHEILNAVKAEGCRACPVYNKTEVNRECAWNCKIEILRNLQRKHDRLVELQQRFYPDC